MYIGSLLNKEKCPELTYNYYKRGTKIPYVPDLICESSEHINTNLLDGCPISFNRLNLRRDGIDIKFEFGKSVFVDHFLLELGEYREVGVSDDLSHIKKMEVLTEKDGKKVIIGVYRPETGKDITDKNINISVAYHCDNVILRIHGMVRPIVIEKLDICGAISIDKAIYPIPSSLIECNAVLRLNSITGIIANGCDELFAAEYLNECIQYKFGTEYPITEETACPITFNVCDMNKESYKLSIDKDGIAISGGDRSGLLYACCALIQLIENDAVRCVEIEDSPFMELRGFHIGLPTRENLPFFKRMIKHLLLPMRYNTVFLQPTATMRYDNFPEINTWWLKQCEEYEKFKNGEAPKPAHYGSLCHEIWEKDEVRELVSFMRSYGVDVIPEVQTLGHTQYITSAYPELAEIADENSETGINELFKAREGLSDKKAIPDACCPNHPHYYEVICGILDEIIDVFQPRKYISIGHDEVYSLGICKRCKDLEPSDIFADEVTKLNDYIKSKGLKTMMWSDMLHELPYDYHKTESAVDKIPKDVIILDFVWYCLKGIDCEQRFIRRGFDVVLGNFYSSGFPRFDTRKKTDRLLGAEVSAWIACEEEKLAFHGKMYDVLYSANCMWSFEHNQAMRRTYDEIIKNRIPFVRSILRGESPRRLYEQSIDLSCNALLAPCELRDVLENESINMAGLENPSVTIDINNKAEAMCFTHATDNTAPRIQWGEPFKIGEYEVLYEDGTTESIDISYALNILEYTRIYAKPLKADIYGHMGYFATYLADPVCGKTTFGDDYTLYKYIWINPHKNKQITSVTLKHSGTTDANILLFDVSLGC